MGFKVKIRNIGKLADAEINVGDFTVFAGPNNTGKSFVSKLLYSFFDATNANLAEMHINHLVEPIKGMMRSLRRRNITDDEELLLSSLAEELQKLDASIKDISLEERDEAISTFVSQIQKTAAIMNDICQLPFETLRTHLIAALMYVLHEAQDDLSDLIGMLEQKDISQLINIGLQYKVHQNLIRNFQVPRVDDIKGGGTDRSQISIEGFGKIKISAGEIRCDINSSHVRQLRRYSRVIYLESPVYWKLKKALEYVEHSLVNASEEGRTQLSSVPGYFHDLADALRFEYTGGMAFPDVYKKLTGDAIIGGKIAITENGDLSFQENGRSFSLPVTAMGVANLGILALLIERKVLDEDTLLFIDEPEAHLHPAWQVVMAEALFELARQGVNVVIATHSIDILKWLEVHVKKNPADEQLVALNQFPVEASEVGEDFRAKMAEIKHELTEPFSDLYLKGL